MRDEKILSGSKWQHFKGDVMEVITLAIHSETLEQMVVYKHSGNIWVRPVSIFLSDEDVSGRTDNKTGQNYRFVEIKDNRKDD